MLSVSQREFDENEVDPYHGQQDKRPEPEAMDLPEDLNLDKDEEAGDDGEGEGDGETCWLVHMGKACFWNIQHKVHMAAVIHNLQMLQMFISFFIWHRFDRNTGTDLKD